jgi:hypothetical protein
MRVIGLPFRSLGVKKKKKYQYLKQSWAFFSPDEKYGNLKWK